MPHAPTAMMIVSLPAFRRAISVCFFLHYAIFIIARHTPRSALICHATLMAASLLDARDARCDAAESFMIAIFCRCHIDLPIFPMLPFFATPSSRSPALPPPPSRRDHSCFR